MPGCYNLNLQTVPKTPMIHTDGRFLNWMKLVKTTVFNTQRCNTKDEGYRCHLLKVLILQRETR